MPYFKWCFIVTVSGAILLRTEAAAYHRFRRRNAWCDHACARFETARTSGEHGAGLAERWEALRFSGSQPIGLAANQESVEDERRQSAEDQSQFVEAIEPENVSRSCVLTIASDFLDWVIDTTIASADIKKRGRIGFWSSEVKDEESGPATTFPG